MILPLLNGGWILPTKILVPALTASLLCNAGRTERSWKKNFITTTKHYYRFISLKVSGMRLVLPETFYFYHYLLIVIMGIDKDIQQSKFRNVHQKVAINLIYTVGWMRDR